MPPSNTPVPQEPKPPDQVRDRTRVKHYSIRTETQYAQWVRRFILFHGKRHPLEMGAREVEAFLSHLAVDAKVAAATQNQALSALLFQYREVLGVTLPWLDNVNPRQTAPAPAGGVDARGGARGPVAYAGRVCGNGRLVVWHRHAPDGMRSVAREGCGVCAAADHRARREGARDRVTMLPQTLADSLQAHLRQRRALFEDDLRAGNANGCIGGGHRENGHAPHATAFVRHPSAGARTGYSHHSGAARSQGRTDHHDLYPCHEPGRTRRGESAGFVSG